MTHTITIEQRPDGMIRLSFGWLVMYFETHETDEIAAYVKKYAEPHSCLTVVDPIDEEIVKLVREQIQCLN